MREGRSAERFWGENGLVVAVATAALYFQARVGSREPYGIDEAHDLFERLRTILYAESVMLRRQIAFGAITAVILGCSADTPAPTALELRAPLYAVRANSDINLGTHLTGDEEVLTVAAGAPHPSDSKAQGQAIFRVNDDGVTVDFRLIASNIDNVVQAHIHCGRRGTNGPINQWLYPNTGSGPALTGPTGSQNGVLATGTFSTAGRACTAASLGQPATNPPVPLLTAIRDGLAYVNVHTNDGAAPANTGPGDFPGGEIRGQIDDENN